jgi:hypothetical protein
MPPPNLQSIDSSFQLAEYLALLIKRDPRDVEGIVDLPASGASADPSGSGASPVKAKNTDTDKDGQGERQGAGAGSRGGNGVGSPNGSGRKKEVDLVSPFLSLSWVLSSVLVFYPRLSRLEPRSSILRP